MYKDAPSFCEPDGGLEDRFHGEVSATQLLNGIDPCRSAALNIVSIVLQCEQRRHIPGTVTEFRFVAGILLPVTPWLRTWSIVKFAGERPEPLKAVTDFVLAL